MKSRDIALKVYAEAQASLEPDALARAALLMMPFPDLAPGRLRAEWLLARYTRDPATLELASDAYIQACPSAASEIQRELVRIYLDRGKLAQARSVLKSHTFTKGWRRIIVKFPPPRWRIDAPLAIRTERRGTLLAGGRDWFTFTSDGTTDLNDAVNSGPEGGQYTLCITANGYAALKYPQQVQSLGRDPHVLIGSNGNYYHWMLDFFPRLKQAMEAPKLASLPLIVGTDLAVFEQEALAAFGIKDTQIKQLPSGTAWSYDRLHVPTIGTMHQQPHPDVIAWLRATFGVITSPTRRIWISRHDAKTRRLINEDEIIAALTPLGFESVTLTGMSIRDQAVLFASAEIVVGPHGAAFTNLLFCQPGTRVIEIMPGQFGQLDFFSDLASACAVSHSRVIADPAIAKEDPGYWDVQNRDMIIDPRLVIARI